jgi:putative ABC transport system ATP-binding protein
VLRQGGATLYRGESVAILGKSGTGKSTLLNLISGIDRTDTGAIWVNGRELTALDERQRTLFRRHNIGSIFQVFDLIPHPNGLGERGASVGTERRGQRRAPRAG